MRLTTKTNLAARVLMACAFNRGKTLRTSEIAQVTHEDLTRGNCGLEALLNVPKALADACSQPVASA